MPNITTNYGITYTKYLKYKIFYIPLLDTLASLAVDVFLFIVYKEKKTIFVNLNHSSKYKRN